METGAVGLVLRLSRVMGIAPYPRGSGTRVSKAFIVYRFILVTFICIYVLSMTCVFLINQKPPLLARDITHAIDDLVSVTLVLLGAYTAPGRMRRMARSLKQLEQINKKTPYIKAIPKDRITFWLIIVFISGNFIIYVINIITLTLVISENVILWPFDYIIYYVEQSLVVLLEMQLVAFAARVLLTLEMINKSLQHLSRIQSKHSPRINTINRYFRAPKVAWEVANSEDTPGDVNNANTNDVNEDVLGTTKAEGTEYIIRQLAVHNRHICDMIRTWTASDGLLMTLILLNRMFNLMINLHRLIMGFTHHTDIFLTVLFSSLINCIRNVAALLLFVEPFQRTHMQMERTSMIVQSLKCNCGEYQPVRNELDLFLKMSMLQKTSYSPLSMYTLGRPLVLKINRKIPYIGAIPKDRTTFWVIVVFIFGSFIIHVIDTLTIVSVVTKNIWYVYFIIYYVEQSLVVLLEMQVVAFAARILLTLEMINKSLQHLSCIQSKHSPRMNTINRYFRAPKVAWEVANSEGTPGDVNNANTNNVNEDVLGTNKAEGTEYIIRQLSVHNRHICDIIRTWIASDGLLMTLILLSRMSNLVINIHTLIMGFTQNTDILLNTVIYSSINVIEHVAAVLLFVEPFHRTHMQMERTPIIVQTLKCNCGEYQPVRNELDLFLKTLMLQKTSYSPLSMYTLGRPLVLKIFGGFITYLVAVLTYGPEAKRPTLFYRNAF